MKQFVVAWTQSGIDANGQRFTNLMGLCTESYRSIDDAKTAVNKSLKDCTDDIIWLNCGDEWSTVYTSRNNITVCHTILEVPPLSKAGKTN